MRQLRFSLTFYILSALSCLLVLTWVLLSLISFKTAENDLIAQKGEEARLILASVAELLPRPLAPPAVDSAAERYVRFLAAEKGFAGLVIVDGRGSTVYALSDPEPVDAELAAVPRTGKGAFRILGDGGFVRRYLPITENGRTVGAARLTLSLAAEKERLKSSRHLFLAYFALDFLLLLVLGSALLTRAVVVPIRKLVAATRRIAEGNLDETVREPWSTETAELSDSFNAMVIALREKRREVEEKVTSLNRANAELIEARGETIRSEKMASVGLLAAGMAHEIGTPLAAIMGYTGILAEELAEDPEKSDYLRRLDAESRRIDRIVRGLLDYARPRKASTEEVELLPLMEKTVELLDAQGVLKLLTVSVVAEGELPPVTADPYQLEQLLINLIMNARDAMPNGGELTVRGRREGEEVVVEVIDSGEGIAPDKLTLVFDPFFTTKEPGKGTGLGLSIAARIAESYGGRITVESELGKGSRFALRIPKREL